MKYLTILALLIFITQSSQSSFLRWSKLEVQEGDRVAYTIPEETHKILSCIVSRDGQFYSLYPEFNLTNGINESSSQLCTFGFSNASLSDAGKWDIHTVRSIMGYKIHSTYTVEVYVHMKTTILPKAWFISEDENYVTVFPQYQFSHITNCSVTHYNHLLAEENYDLFNLIQDDQGIERYGLCGVRIRVDESKYGHWELVQFDGQYKKIQLRFQLWKNYEKNYNNNDVNLVWHHGFLAEISLPQYLKYTYCKIIQPDGQYTVLEFENCTKQIDQVHYVHEGVWEIQYNVPELFNTMTKRYNVTVQGGLKTHNISVTVKTENNRTNLLCTLSQADSGFCLFIKPDGSALNIPEGIGNDKYEYYGKGYNYKIHETPHSDCGLTINQPTADDFGLWECSFGKNSKSADNYRAFLSLIDSNTINMNGAYVSNYYYVKQGDSLQIECPRYASLDYCWLYGPDGAIYPRSNHKYSGKTSMFKDRDLAAGICSTTIGTADKIHQGNWSCLLGTVGGDEISVANAIVVSVADSYLSAHQSVMKINKNGKTTLTLNLLPEKYATISYCRWHHPNGTEIPRKKSSKYSFSRDRKSCSLTINEYDADSIGDWACYAGLLDDTDQEVFNGEVFASVTVIDNASDSD